jgi:hypothetical protein
VRDRSEAGVLGIVLTGFVFYYLQAESEKKNLFQVLLVALLRRLISPSLHN